MFERLLYPVFGTILTIGGAFSAFAQSDPPPVPPDVDTAHDFEFTAIEGGPLPLSQFAGKAVLIVNTASFCGFTHQYQGLQTLWSEYRDKGLVVLGVPSNDFGRQEPGTSEEIKTFCEGAYGIDFPMSEKVNVRGKEAHPFYQWARAVLGTSKAPRWNFHKYLIDAEGVMVDAFDTTVRPDDRAFRSRIEQVLASL